MLLIAPALAITLQQTVQRAAEDRVRPLRDHEVHEEVRAADDRARRGSRRDRRDAVGRRERERRGRQRAGVGEREDLAEEDAAHAVLAARIAGVPKNQLMMQKLMINQAYENMGLANTQMIATLFDGITRHSPEGVWFKKYAEKHGFHAAVKWRDGGRPIP